MKSSSVLLRLGILGVLCCFFIGGGTLLAEKKVKRFTVDKIVALVNDEPITYTDLQRSLLPLLKQLKSKFSKEELFQKMEAAKTKVLEQLIDNKLILQTALNLKEQLEIPEKRILQYVERIIAQFPSREVFDKTLKAENISFEEFKQDSLDQLRVKHLVSREVSSKVYISNSDIKLYYESHYDQYQIPAKISFAQIWLKKEPSDLESPKKKIESIRKEIEGGADFQAQAKKFSQGAHRLEGGVWKSVKKGQFTSELDEVLWGLKPGELSPIIETPVSFHLIKVDLIEKQKKLPLEEVWENIHDQLYLKRAEQLRLKWLKELRETAFIRIIE